MPVEICYACGDGLCKAVRLPRKYFTSAGAYISSDSVLIPYTSHFNFLCTFES